MRETFCIRFYCREGKKSKVDGKSPVEVSVIVCGERQMWQLPKKCSPKEFKTNKDIQIYCNAIENRLNEVYTNLVINNEPISAFIIRDIFQNGNNRKSYTISQMFEDGLALKARDNDNLSTYQKYVMVTRRFYEMTDRKEKNEANSVTCSDILSFKAGLEKIHEPQTVFKDMQHLKYFFSLAFNSGKIKQNPFGSIKIKSVNKDKPYLTFEEICAIRNLRITNDRLDKVRDIFLFLCFSGLEWADLINLKKDDVRMNEHGQYYIKKPRLKTGITYVSVLYEDAVDIWNLYDGELPLISPQKFNNYLKELAKLADIAKNVSSLTARHSYAVFLLSNRNLSMEVVQKMLGHSNIKETHIYAKLLDNTVFEANRGSSPIGTMKVSGGNTKAEIGANMNDLEWFEENVMK